LTDFVYHLTDSGQFHYIISYFMNVRVYHASVNEIGSHWERTLCTLHCSALAWRRLL